MLQPFCLLGILGCSLSGLDSLFGCADVGLGIRDLTEAKIANTIKIFFMT